MNPEGSFSPFLSSYFCWVQSFPEFVSLWKLVEERNGEEIADTGSPSTTMFRLPSFISSFPGAILGG